MKKIKDFQEKLISNIESHLEAIKGSVQKKRALFRRILQSQISLDTLLESCTDIDIQQKLLLLFFKLVPEEHPITSTFSTPLQLFFTSTKPAEFKLAVRKFLIDYPSEVIGRKIISLEFKGKKIEESIFIFLNISDIKIVWNNEMIVISYKDVKKYETNRNYLFLFVGSNMAILNMDIDKSFLDHFQDRIKCLHSKKLSSENNDCENSLNDSIESKTEAVEINITDLIEQQRAKEIPMKVKEAPELTNGMVKEVENSNFNPKENIKEEEECRDVNIVAEKLSTTSKDDEILRIDSSAKTTLSLDRDVSLKADRMCKQKKKNSCKLKNGVQKKKAITYDDKKTAGEIVLKSKIPLAKVKGAQRSKKIFKKIMFIEKNMLRKMYDDIAKRRKREFYKIYEEINTMAVFGKELELGEIIRK